MRHRKLNAKLGRNSPHLKATLRNLATALFTHERIKTTHAKAKALRPVAERLITLGKRGDLSARRVAARKIHDHDALQKLFGEIAERYKARPGGYTRVLRTGERKGDNAMTAIIELVDAPKKAAPAAPAAADAEAE